jgi:sec-independent protein translocase protein TatA
MLGLDNPIHIAFVLVLVLLVFGAKRLPEMGKSLGSGLRGFKESLTGEDAVTQLHAETSSLEPAVAPEPVVAVSPEPVAPGRPTLERTPVQSAA